MIDWQKLARAETHPFRIRVLEAIDAAGKPVTATDLLPVVGGYLGQLDYHCRELVKHGAILVAGRRKGQKGRPAIVYRALPEGDE